MAIIDSSSVGKMPTAELVEAKKQALDARKHAKRQISNAYREFVKTGIKEIHNEARRAWEPVIAWRNADIGVINDELRRRSR